MMSGAVSKVLNSGHYESSTPSIIQHNRSDVGTVCTISNLVQLVFKLGNRVEHIRRWVNEASLCLSRNPINL